MKAYKIIIIIIISTICLVGCQNKSVGETEKEIEEQVIMDILKDAGVDVDALDEGAKTGSGGTILGDALPAMSYRTLADAEQEFGYYLGLHNKLESLTEYELVAMYIIDNDIMQGIFNNLDETKTITVKTSKVKSKQELISVYNEYEINEHEIIEGIDVAMSGNTSEEINLAYFDVKNGKNYSIFTHSGISREQMVELVSELISNLKIMDDWVE